MDNLDIYCGKRILVTGHTGFKGSWLCEWLLALGADVYGFSNGLPTKPSLFQQLRLSKRIKSDMRGDIRDRAAVREAILGVKPDFVFHLAAQPLVRLSYERPVETFDTNVMGTVNLLDALREYQAADFTNCTNLPAKRPLRNPCNPRNPWLKSRCCSAVFVTTDKCYENKETPRPYRETDPMGGYDPYSCSKGCDELVISSYRRSFFNSPDSPVWIASARAGNVIGGGDWAKDRLVPDAMRAWLGEKKVEKRGGGGQRHVLVVRNSRSTRPWQHVLEPLSGYLALGAALDARQDFANVASGFNFGPDPKSNHTVKAVIEELFKHTHGKWIDKGDPNAVHEAGLLNLDIRKARKVLGWKPKWGFQETIAKVAEWYAGVANGEKPIALTQKQITAFNS